MTTKMAMTVTIFFLSVGRCGSANAKGLDLADLSSQGDVGYVLAQGKNCLARAKGRLRSSADMQASVLFI